MKSKKFKQIAALTGVIIIVGLFILTIIFLLIGNSTMAITLVAVNGFITVMLFFVLHFNKSVIDSTQAFIPSDDPSDHEDL